MLLDAIEAWPEFNLFTAGYVMSRLPADSPRFKEGLEWQWRTLDVCVQERIDRVSSAVIHSERQREGSIEDLHRRRAECGDEGGGF
jgi:hypothetical protein